MKQVRRARISWMRSSLEADDWGGAGWDVGAGLLLVLSAGGDVGWLG